jgi:hypothetical protein
MAFNFRALDLAGYMYRYYYAYHKPVTIRTGTRRPWKHAA